MQTRKRDWYWKAEEDIYTWTEAVLEEVQVSSRRNRSRQNKTIPKTRTQQQKQQQQEEEKPTMIPPSCIQKERNHWKRKFGARGKVCVFVNCALLQAQEGKVCGLVRVCKWTVK